MTTDKTAPHSSKKIGSEKWLWPARIPEGHITLFGGETGAGKSIIAASVIALVTRGAPWPDGAGRAPKGEVLVISEDPVPTMQNPRLLAAGADLTKVRGWNRPSFNIERDLDDLEADIKNHPKTKLIVLDPLQDYLTATTYHGVRSVLLNLVERLRKYKVAIVAMGHPPKGLPYPRDSFGGSRGFPSVARAFWFVTEQDDDTHLMLFVKCNCAGHTRLGMMFRVDVEMIPATRKKQAEGLYAVWDAAPIEMTANDWWFSERGRRSQIEPKRAKDIATAFLKEFLKDGPKNADEVMEAATGEGIKRGTLHSARLELGLIVEKQPGIAHGPWRWSLPATKPEKPTAPPEEPTTKAKRKKQKTNVVELFPKPKIRGGGGHDGGDAA